MAAPGTRACRFQLIRRKRPFPRVVAGRRLGSGLAVVLALGLPSLPAGALPDANLREVVAEVVVFGDDTRPDIFHVVPSRVRPRQASDGGPVMTFKLARYSGTRLSGDQGRVEITSVLRLGLELELPQPAALERAREVLSRRHGRTVELRPLALSRLSAQLLHPRSLETIPAERAHEETGLLWQERDIVLRLAPSEAELLQLILEEETAGLILVWSAHARIKGSPAIAISSSIGDAGDLPFTANELAEVLRAGVPGADPEPVVADVVAAGALALRLTDEERALRIERYDIDAALPPFYPVLTALCFTFADGLRPDLLERIIEVEATTFGGWPTRSEAIFSAERSDRTTAPLAFEHAVDLRQPYRWRILDMAPSGEIRAGDWTTADRWDAFIDVTRATLAAPPEDGDFEEGPQ